MFEYWEETRHIWRIRCAANWDAPECSGATPQASSPEEARELAEGRGWEVIDGRWCCPHHLRELEKAKNWDLDVEE